MSTTIVAKHVETRNESDTARRLTLERRPLPRHRDMWILRPTSPVRQRSPTSPPRA